MLTNKLYPILIYIWTKEAKLSQISYLLVVMHKLNGISEIQYKKVMIIGNE